MNTKMNGRSGLAAILALTAMALGACAAPAGDEASGGAGGVPAAEDDGNPEAPVEETAEPARPAASIELGPDHRVDFVEISGAGTLVFESARPGDVSALDALTDLRAEGVTVHDVFHALAPAGVEAPAAIAHYDRRLVERARGWGREIATAPQAPQATRAGGQDACANATFTASTYGGILPNNSAWLDRHPNVAYDQYLYSDYSSGILTQHTSTRYSYTLNRSGVHQFRAKACFETREGAGQPVHRYVNLGTGQVVQMDPTVRLLYRSGNGGWYSATSMTVPVGQTKSFQWAWFGNGSTLDWRFQASRAQPQDVLDYMRSYL